MLLHASIINSLSISPVNIQQTLNKNMPTHLHSLVDGELEQEWGRLIAMKAMVILSGIMWQWSIHVLWERDSSGTRTKDHSFNYAHLGHVSSKGLQDLVSTESEIAKRGTTAIQPRECNIKGR
jgi:hypothetical protein